MARDLYWFLGRFIRHRCGHRDDGREGYYWLLPAEIPRAWASKDYIGGAVVGLHPFPRIIYDFKYDQSGPDKYEGFGNTSRTESYHAEPPTMAVPKWLIGL